jgi:hypothetical protein
MKPQFLKFSKSASLLDAASQQVSLLFLRSRKNNDAARVGHPGFARKIGDSEMFLGK